MAGGTLGGSGGRRAPIVGINVTPMVDVVLVLLVIMMVSATYIVSQSMHVELPKASNGDPGEASVAAVTIARDGAISYNDTPVTEAVLSQRLRAAHADNAELTVVVSADQGASHGRVVHVLDVAKAVGITSFAIGVEQPE
jgi:biopolymer transport protein ExbD